MDSLFSGELTSRGYELSFNTLFSKFAENGGADMVDCRENLIIYQGAEDMEFSGLEVR